MITFKIYVHPQAKERPRLGRSRVYTPKKTWGFEQLLKLKFRMQVRDPLDGPLSLEYNCYFKAPKKNAQKYKTSRPDIDNLLKSVMDAGNEILWKDDAQIVEATVRKFYSEEDREYIEIKVTPISIL